jgi:hypothetical protein
MPTVDAHTHNNTLGRLAADYHHFDMAAGFFHRDLSRIVGAA